MALPSTNSTAMKHANREHPVPTTDTPSQQISFPKDGITITRIRHHSFHSSTTTRPVTHSEAPTSSPYLPHSDLKHVRFASGNSSLTNQPRKARTSSVSSQGILLSSLADSKVLSPDRDLDRLATQLLEQLDLVDESLGVNSGEVQQFALESTPLLSPKPESFVRLRPADKVSGDSTNAQSISSDSSTTAMAEDPGMMTSTGQSHDFITHPRLETIYANIIDLTAHSKSKQTTSESGLAKLLRRVKGLCSIRLANNRPTIQLSKNAELLGVVLAPPQGSCHFDVQLTLCGLLRRNAASPYELYHFFLENGFFVHLPQPPSYEEWAANYSDAVDHESPFYHEGIRVGLDGEMDFLRNLFQEWCEAWHDWRLSRPIPESQKFSASGKLAKWSSKISR